MKTRRGIVALAAGALLALAPGLAHAQDEGAVGALARLQYCATGGILSGVGPQGVTLGRGPSFAFQVRGESAIGMQLGVEAAYATSNDIFNTKFQSLSLISRLSPTPEDYRAYVQLGAGVYHITFDADQPNAAQPENTVRPGGSFGLGLELMERTQFTLGGLVTYNGVVLKRSDARSYLTAGVTLSFKPSSY